MAHLIVRGAGGAAQRVDLGGDVFRIGCVLDNDLQLDDDAVSAHHAQLRCGELGYTLSALAGAGGLFVNDRPVQERLLRTGDEIRVGRTRLTFEYDESDAPPVPAG